jgi:pimeloyl-ACP methyl ester carboxylesterase
MKAWKSWLAVLLTAWLLSGCGGDGIGDPDNEQVVSGRVVVDFPADLLRKKLMEAGTPGIDANTTVFGYKAFRIEYETVDEAGLPVTASGLMVVPTDSGTTPTDARKIAYMYSVGLSVVSDSHGTIFADREAPTAIAEATLAPDGSPVILTSLSGFVTLQADYIGFGASSDHYHPYLLKRSSAAATVDFIDAARRFAEENGIPLNGQLYVTGYSEGGYVAMAALQSLEDRGEAVVYAAPMAGPYMMDQMAKGVLSREPLPIPSFMANVAYAYALSYGQPLNGLVQEPYAGVLPSLLDGSLTRPEIDARLPHTTTGLFTEEAITRVLGGDESFWFNQALFANSTAYWAPGTSVRLVHCLGDDVVPYEMSRATAELMRDRLGARDVAEVPVEIAVTGDPATELRWGHVECAPYAYGVTAKIFSDVRAQTVGY